MRIVKADELLSEADRKRLHPHAAQPRDDIVAPFVNEH